MSLQLFPISIPGPYCLRAILAGKEATMAGICFLPGRWAVKVSVLIPAYNEEELMGETLDSLGRALPK